LLPASRPSVLLAGLPAALRSSAGRRRGDAG
jgi:hypothetical protein